MSENNRTQSPALGNMKTSYLFYSLYSILIGFSCLKITLPAVALSNRELKHDDGDGNENGKKAIALDKENNNFARASHFLHISLPSFHDYDVKLPNFTFYGGREYKTIFFFFSWT